MIYFIHGFEWPYDKEHTAKISEYNDLKPKEYQIEKIGNLEIETPKAVTREIIIHNNTPENFFKIEKKDEISYVHIDELIYRNKTDNESPIPEYGFVSKDNTEDAFWEQFIKTIDTISENNPEIRKIRIPISLFMGLYSNRSKDLLFKIYDVLSPKEQYDFFILLESPEQIHFVYDNFKDSIFIDGSILRRDSQIISCFDQISLLSNASNLAGTNLGLGVCDYFSLNQNLCFIQKTAVEETESFINTTIEICERILKKSTNVTYQNFRNRIKFEVEQKRYLRWFKEEYVSYKQLINYASKIYKYAGATSDIEKVIKDFYRLFGYSCPLHDGKITNEFRQFIQKKKLEQQITLEKIATKHNEFYEKLKTCTKKIYKDWDSRTVSAIMVFNAKKGPKVINRLWLYYFVYSLSLNLEAAEYLFTLSDCIFKDSYLPEDKILCELLSNGKNLKRLGLDLFVEHYKKMCP